MDFSETVKASYNQIAEPYLAQRGADTADVRLLAPLIERLSPDCAVLDAGCGAGVPITRILAESFRVTGVDFAEAQVARARPLVPTAQFVCADGLRIEWTERLEDAGAPDASHLFVLARKPVTSGACGA